MSKYFTIAIDGPSGVGKTTIAGNLAKTLGIMHLDTGAMYRALGLASIRENLDPNLSTTAEQILDKYEVKVCFQNQGQHTYLNDEDVSDFLRTEEVSMAASTISKHPLIRTYLTELQRSLAEHNSFVLEGRDIGTVVLPQATLKIFLSASNEARTERRYNDLKKKGHNVRREDIERDLLKRDKQDSERAVAPLRQAEDAICIDSSEFLPEDTLNEVIKIIKQRNILNSDIDCKY